MIIGMIPISADGVANRMLRSTRAVIGGFVAHVRRLQLLLFVPAVFDLLPFGSRKSERNSGEVGTGTDIQRTVNESRK